jgi:type I restriction enzyme, R subunit
MPTPEAIARETIDGLLIAAGWTIQNYKQVNLGAGQGIAIREVPLKRAGETGCSLT